MLKRNPNDSAIVETKKVWNSEEYKINFGFYFQSVVESILIFVVLITLSRYFVDARPEPQGGGLASGFGQLAGSALGKFNI